MHHRLRIASLLFASTSAVSVAHAAELAVGGGEPGAYATIQDALDNARPGDTITIAPGEYREALRTRVDADAGSPIRIVAQRGGQPVTISNPEGVALSVDHAGYSLENIGFARSQTHVVWNGAGGMISGGVMEDASGNAVQVRSGDVTISNAVIRGAGASGVLVTGDARARLEDAAVVGASRSGISLDSAQARLTVLNSVVRDSVGNAIDVSAGQAFVRGTTLDHNRTGGIVSDGVGAEVIALNNTIDANGERGISVGSGRATIVNNAITGAPVALHVGDGANVQAHHNLYHGNLADTVGIEGVDTDVHGNPGYVNPDANDYRISASSAALDTGFDVGSDYGPGAITGNAFDIGAYEYVPLPGGGGGGGEDAGGGMLAGGSGLPSRAVPIAFASPPSSSDPSLFGPVAPLMDGGGGPLAGAEEGPPSVVPAPSALMTVAGSTFLLLRRRRK